MKQGELVFFKKFKTDARRGMETTFRGYGMGLLLGHLENGQPLPTRQQFMYLVANSGLIKFDDVAEFLGDAAVDELMKKFHLKYGFSPTEKDIEEEKKALDEITGEKS